MLPAKPEPMPGHWSVAPGRNLWLALDRPRHPARVRILTAVVVPCRCGMPSGSRNAIGPVDRYGGRPGSAASHCGGVPGIVNSGSPAASGIQWQPSATAWSSCALLSWSTGIRRGSSSGAGPRRARRILSGQPGERAALTATQGVHVAQAVAPPPGCRPDRRAVTETWALSCRGRAGGTTFRASARVLGITTRYPAEVRAAKESASLSSRMPRTSAICSPPSGLRRRQRITTRWPASAGVSRASSR